MVVAPIVVLGVVTYVVSKRQDPVYRASGQVLLNHQDQVATSIVGVQTPVPDPGRYAVTQTLVAWTPALARRVLDAAGVRRWSPKNLLDHTSIWPNADVLTFTVRGGDADETARLAAAWPRQFTLYRRELDTRDLSQTLGEIQARLDGLQRDGDTSSRLYSSLAAKAQDVRLLEALRQSNVYVIRTPSAGDVEQVAPRPLRNAATAAAVGLLVGLVAALLLEALDTRVRSAEELEQALGLSLLGRVPISAGWGAEGAVGEAFLTLRTNVALANLELRARTLLVTGAGRADGAAAVGANLAAAAARAGGSVVLVDLDLRDGTASRLFGLSERSGVTNVVLGDVAPDAALTPVDVGRGAAAAGSLRVLATGARPDRPGELAASSAVAAILSDLRERADLVIAVAPPILFSGDALALGGAVDALVLVARDGESRRGTVRELRRALAAWPAATLGLVLTGEARRGGLGGAAARLRGALRPERRGQAAATEATQAERTAESWR